MKTRIFKTKFWTDNVVSEMKSGTKLVFLYLITSHYIGQSSIFECSPRTIGFYTGLSEEVVEKIQHQLESTGRAFFYKSWIWLVNAEKHTNYRKGPAMERSYHNELAQVPKDVMKYFADKGYSPSTPPGTHNPENINQNTRNQLPTNNRREVSDFI